jgi:beta-glucanase (GH16 family)
MCKILLVLLALAALAGLLAAGSILGESAPAPQKPTLPKQPRRAGTMKAEAAQARKGWKLVWADEFDYTGLPDPEKWDYEEGFIRNWEAQYYTRARPENARVEDGTLIIEGRKEKFPNPHYRPGGKGPQVAEYTAASLITLGKAAWQYGRVEVRAKLPQGRGVWPAIWMLGTNRGQVGWPACGEIDIMEFVGHTPDRVHANVHWRGGDGKHQATGGKLKVERPWDDFHVYALEWTDRQMDFFFDETKYFSFQVEKATDEGDNAFRLPHYLLINLALGGSWGGAIDDEIFPQKYVIDYVRVYERASEE